MSVTFLTGYTASGSVLKEDFVKLADLYYQPSCHWFNDPVDKDSVLATTPNVFEWGACANYGRIATDDVLRMDSAHFHLMVDGIGAQFDLELWRLRSAAFVRVATATLASGSGDGAFAAFAFADENARLCEKGDYFFLQATAKMNGTPIGFVDVHYDPAPIIVDVS